MTLSKDVQRLLDQRYLQPGEDWNGLVKRVVDHVCDGESNWYKQEVTEHITRRIWLPNSPCLVGSGTKTGGLFACFVVGPDEDTLEHHVEVLGDIAAVGKRGGGCGFTGTGIRPKGMPVAGSVHGFSYGPNWWATQVSSYLDGITQGGFRKFAGMYTLLSSHPDLNEFIDLKQSGNEKLNYNFNQSVMATDEWMREAVNGDDGERFQLIKMAKNAWNNGEPGLLFHTTINENTPYKTCGCKIEATNPCQPEFAIALTKNGEKQIGELSVGDEIYSVDGWVKVVRIVPQGVKPVYAYEIDGYGNFVGTKDHKIKAESNFKYEVDRMFANQVPVPCLNEKDGSVNYATITSRAYVGDYKVYSLTVDGESHSYWTSGVSVQNCGEQPIPSYGSCNLGSINISHEYFYDEQGRFDYARLSRVVSVLTRFLDNVGTRNIFPNDKFKNWYEKHRPIGIGIMGYADALLKMKLKYGEQSGLDFLESIMGVIQNVSYSTSETLGEERGVPEHCQAVGRRNITTVSIAPTGSIGFISECSHGIEPIFSPVYQRTDERGETYLFSHPLRNEPYFASCLNDDKTKIPTWKQHIDVQATVQKNCDSAVSKTVNMSNDARVQDVLDAFVYAWESGCKGITVYRDGSRQFQVLEDVKEEDSLLQDCPSGVCEL
jgi:ribonucleotide reductase alpha subunit